MDTVAKDLFKDVCNYTIYYTDTEYREKGTFKMHKVDREIDALNELGFDIDLIVNKPISADIDIPARILLEA